MSVYSVAQKRQKIILLPELKPILYLLDQLIKRLGGFKS
jgi:hypothetical protein